MLQQGEVWFLIVDGRQARVLAEVRRGAELRELSDWTMSLSDEDALEAQDRPPRTFDRVGPGRHAVGDDRDLRQEEEDRFAKRVVERLEAASQAGAFAHLVVAAPPRALGVFRGLLSSALQAKLRADIAKDLLKEDAAALKPRLEAALRAA